MERRLVTIDELTQLIPFSKKAIYHLVNRRQIPFVKIGRGRRGRVLFDLKQIETWIQKNSKKVIDG